MAIENSVLNDFFYLRSLIILVFSIVAYPVWVSYFDNMQLQLQPDIMTI